MWTDIDLRLGRAEDLIRDLPNECTPLMHLDFPWTYSGGQQSEHHGLAGHHYPGTSDEALAAVLDSTFRLGTSNSYCALWITFPKAEEFAVAALLRPLREALHGITTADDARAFGERLWHESRRGHRLPAALAHLSGVQTWDYVSGAAWGKHDRKRGVGYHFTGDAELCLLLKKGRPRPLRHVPSNLWLAPRGTHSEKPQLALRTLLAMATRPGDLVVDPYAGKSGSMARACGALGRAYIGTEIDPEYHAEALRRIEEASRRPEMAWEESA